MDKKKTIKASSKRNIKNALIAFSGLMIGVIGASGGAYLLIEKNEVVEKNQITMNNELQKCKALGARQGFRLNEEKKGNVTFYLEDLDPDNTYSSIVATMNIGSSCPTMEMVKACFGWSCDEAVPDAIKEDVNGMPFFFTMEEIYERSDDS